MNEELKKAFNKLDIDEKRNQISNELIRINTIISQLEMKYNIKNNTQIKNYDPISDCLLNESDILTYFYEDIYCIEQELYKLIAFNGTSKK